MATCTTTLSEAVRVACGEMHEPAAAQPGEAPLVEMRQRMVRDLEAFLSDALSRPRPEGRQWTAQAMIRRGARWH